MLSNSSLPIPNSCHRQSFSPCGGPFLASRITIGCDADVKGETEYAVSERDRSDLAWFKWRPGSMRLKFVQQVPDTVQGIADDQHEREPGSHQTHQDERQDRGCFQRPGMRRAEVSSKCQIEHGYQNQEHGIKNLLRFGRENLTRNEDGARSR